MGARTKLLFLLVASFLGIVFALIPATDAEIQISQIEHLNTQTDNSLNITITNNLDKEIPYSLIINILCGCKNNIRHIKIYYLGECTIDQVLVNKKAARP